MNEATLTLALNGDVPLKEFSAAVQGFCEMVYGLTEELAPQAGVAWVIDALEAGSAIATVKGTSEDAKSLTRIVSAYTEVGKALRERTAIPYSLRVAKAAREVAGVLNGDITSVRFETDIEEVYVSAVYSERREPSFSYAIGTIKGTVESLSRRRGVRFTIYDALFDKPVNCYLEPGHEADIKDHWGKKVLVSGIIGRDSDTGKPINVRRIAEIRLAESSEAGSYRKARGVLNLEEGETPEGLTRKVRDVR